ncbi:MAG: secondary thiamine-phosphate synthase enzyme YjbQ [Rhodobacteraceae bacterium]|nr:secondary thiamine-phosphate synthase enzyme YjbQ [Paracoccaceae bacterium]
MEQRIGQFEVRTGGPGLTLITDPIAAWVAESASGDGLLTLLCQHTSASLTIQENVSPEVLDDLGHAFDRLAPRDIDYAHTMEGPDDMPAHIRTVLSGVHLTIPVQAGRLMLGTWQGVYLWEHRDRPHHRTIAAHLFHEHPIDL